MRRSEISRQLGYFQRLANDNLQGDKLAYISQEISYIRQKADDPRLYVAVVGEFSSGKSTFINALLRYRLLKDAVMPTTACATYIIKGKSLCVAVKFHGVSKQFIATANDFRQLAVFIRESFGVTATSLQQIIDTVTSEQHVAETVSEIIIKVPTEYLPDDVVIIDTPGFNPGEDEYSSHFDITRWVVDHVADTALILMPSSQPFSNAIKYFTQQYLQRYISHCLFVLTKMDQKPDQTERQEIIDFVSKHIKHNFNTDDAKVFGECAISMIPGIKAPPTLEEFFNYWRTQFRHFTDFLWRYVAKQRDIIISNHLLHLQLQLIADLKASLAETHQTLSRDQQALESTKIADIHDVTENMRISTELEVKGLVDEVKSAASKIVELYRDKSVDFAMERMVAGKMYKFESEIKIEIIKDVRQNLDAAFSECNKLIAGRLRPKIADLTKSLQQDFNSHYQTLSALPPARDTFNEIEIKSLEGYIVKLDDSSTAISKVQSKGGGKIMGGTIAGATAGMVFGPVGAVIGGIAGFILGGRSSDKDEIEQIDSIREKVRQDIASHYLNAASTIKSGLDDIAKSINRDFDRYCKQHITVFGDTVNEMIRKHKSQIAANQLRLKQLTAEIRKLEDLYDNLKFEDLLRKANNNGNNL